MPGSGQEKLKYVMALIRREGLNAYDITFRNWLRTMPE